MLSVCVAGTGPGSEPSTPCFLPTCIVNPASTGFVAETDYSVEARLLSLLATVGLVQQQQHHWLTLLSIPLRIR